VSAQYARLHARLHARLRTIGLAVSGRG